MGDRAIASGFRIVEGRVYKYNGGIPPGCKGGLYRVVKFVIDVPSYQEKVVIRCVLGKDKGLWFVCTPDNFARRYEPLVVSVGAEEEEEDSQSSLEVNPIPLEGKVMDLSERGSGH